MSRRHPSLTGALAVLIGILLANLALAAFFVWQSGWGAAAPLLVGSGLCALILLVLNARPSKVCDQPPPTN
jgi:hypothetical protein